MSLPLKMTAFWDFRCILVEVHRRFRGAYCYHPDGGSSTLVYFYETTRRHTTECCRFRSRGRDNLKYLRDRVEGIILVSS
jgi:hypothetical protein